MKLTTLSMIMALGVGVLSWSIIAEAQAQPGGAERPPERGFPPLQVVGTAIYGDTKIALVTILDATGNEIGMQHVSEAERVEGYRVVEIRPGQVTFERAGQTFLIPVRRMRPPAPSALPPPPAEEKVVPGAGPPSTVVTQNAQQIIAGLRHQNGFLIASGGVALLPSVSRLLVVEPGRIRVFDLNGRQVNVSIPTRGEVSVAVAASRIVVTDEGRVRIFDPNGNQQGLSMRQRGF